MQKILVNGIVKGSKKLRDSIFMNIESFLKILNDQIF